MDISQVLNDERQRLLEQLAELSNQMKAIDAQAAKLQIELNAIAAYESAKEGKTISKKSTSSRKTSTPQQGIRKIVLDIIASSPEGIKRSTLLDQSGAKGDKTKEQSITNAASALKRKGFITLENGLYKAVQESGNPA